MANYTIKSLEDRFQKHTFEINGAIALKNYTAEVNGERIIIKSTSNSSLSILECMVSEVEIDGKVYTNPVTAQRALQSIVYSKLPIVVLTEEEKKKLILKTSESDPNAKKFLLGDGSYSEVDFSTKADKVEGKGLSTNDYTDSDKEKLDSIETYILKISGNINTNSPINNLSLKGRTVVTIGTSNIMITIDSEDGFVCSFQKCGTGDVTFQAGAGKELIQVDDTFSIDGEEGSTATVTVVGSKIFLRISNV